jgi:hypothetical protein
MGEKFVWWWWVVVIPDISDIPVISKSQSRINKSCCFVLQYNTETQVLVLQYYFEK